MLSFHILPKANWLGRFLARISRCPSGSCIVALQGLTGSCGSCGSFFWGSKKWWSDPRQKKKNQQLSNENGGSMWI